MVKGGQSNAMRAEERIHRAGPNLTGKIVVIDPALTRAVDPDLKQRAERITYDLARRVEGRLVATGVQAFLTTQGGDAEPRTQAERAEFANRTDANLWVSLSPETDPETGVLRLGELRAALRHR